MVQRDQWDTYWGPKKLIFLIRDIDDATRAGASMESCRFVVLRSPRGRLGSELDMGCRLRRVRERFDQWIQIKTGPQQYADLSHRGVSLNLLVCRYTLARFNSLYKHGGPEQNNLAPWYMGLLRALAQPSTANCELGARSFRGPEALWFGGT